MKDIHDYSLKQHNTFGIEARCDQIGRASCRERV